MNREKQLIELIQQLEALLGNKGEVYSRLKVSGAHFLRVLKSPKQYSDTIEVLIHKAKHIIDSLNNQANESQGVYGNKRTGTDIEDPKWEERISNLENRQTRLENILTFFAEFQLSNQSDEDKKTFREKLSNEGLRIGLPTTTPNLPIKNSSPKNSGRKKKVK